MARNEASAVTVTIAKVDPELLTAQINKLSALQTYAKDHGLSEWADAVEGILNMLAMRKETPEEHG